MFGLIRLKFVTKILLRSHNLKPHTASSHYGASVHNTNITTNTTSGLYTIITALSGDMSKASDGKMILISPTSV